MNTFRLPVICTIVLVYLGTSCAEHDISQPDYSCPPSQPAVLFDSQIKPIILENCAISGCHNGDNGDTRNWTNFTLLQSKSANVEDRITRPVGSSGHMPHSSSGKTLTTAQIQLIVCWVRQGAPINN